MTNSSGDGIDPATTHPHRIGYASERAIHGDAGWFDQLVRRVSDALVNVIVSGTPAPPVDRPYRVVPVLGQSNAHGMGHEKSGEEHPPADPMVHQFAACGRRRNQILLAADPLLHGIPGGGAGFATTFGSLLAQATGDPVLLVPCARGDTSFHPRNGHTWDPDDTTTRVNLYDNAVRRIDQAVAAVPGSSVTAILWHQGETDAALSPPAVYRDRLNVLITRLRDGFGAAPFLLGQMVPEWIESGHPKTPLIDAVHREIVTDHEQCAMVAGPRGMYNPPDERIHYSAEGAREMGRRMFATYRAMTETPGV